MSACNFVNDGDDLFVVYGGVRIAKRGRSGTPYAEQWIPLNPEYVVRDRAGQVYVELSGVRLQ
jgi:hypothetical protein